MSLNIYITVLKRKTSLDVILKHKTPSSFSGLITARAEINSTRALPVIARAWLRHCLGVSAPLQQSSITSNAGLRLTTWLSILQRPKSWLSTEPDVGVHPTWLPPLSKEQKGYSLLGSSESSSILSFQWRST